MKKYKNEFIRIAMIAISLVMCFTFVSCGDNEDDNEPKPTSNSIVGTWKSEFSDGYQLLSFNKDGTYTLVEIDNQSGNWSEEGKFTFSENTIIINSREKYQVFTLTSSTLIMRLTHLYIDGQWEFIEENSKDGKITEWIKTN